MKREHIQSFDLYLRTFCRSTSRQRPTVNFVCLIGPTFVRQWNDRVRAFTSHTTSKARSDICFRHHWNLARYLATLPEHSWIRRFLGSKGQRCIGPPKYCWQAGSASHFRAQALNFAYVFFFPCRLDRGMFSSKDCLLVFFFAARRVSGAGLFYWAASRHRLCFLYWPVSRCAVGREGVKSRPSSTWLGGDWSAQLGWCRRGVGRGVEDLRQGCGGWKDLQTEDWQRRKRLLRG